MVFVAFFRFPVAHRREDSCRIFFVPTQITPSLYSENVRKTRYFGCQGKYCTQTGLHVYSLIFLTRFTIFEVRASLQSGIFLFYMYRPLFVLSASRRHGYFSTFHRFSISGNYCKPFSIWESRVANFAIGNRFGSRTKSHQSTIAFRQACVRFFWFRQIFFNPLPLIVRQVCGTMLSGHGTLLCSDSGKSKQGL